MSRRRSQSLVRYPSSTPDPVDDFSSTALWYALNSKNRAIRVGVLLILFVSAALSTPQQKATRVLVLKKEHKMQLYGGESVINTYTVAIGRGGLAPKQRQGDHLTPEGLYEIDRRNKNSRFYRALI